MSGTKAGGMKAAKTNLERHGKGFYARIAGKKGGTISKRGTDKLSLAERRQIYASTH